MEKESAAKSRLASSFTAKNAAQPRTLARNIRWWPWIATAVAVAVGLYAWNAHRPPRLPPVIPPVPVSATAARQSDLDIYLNQIGTVTPFATDNVVSRVAGQIMSIAFKEGELVEPGQLLFQIDPRPYQAQLAQYQGQLARDTATLANARITLERYRVLLQQGVIARQELDNQQALYDQARGTIENDKGLIEAVKVNLGYCRVVSPIRGRIGLRQVDVGNYVQASNTLVVIAQLQPISVIFSMPEDDIATVTADMREGQVTVQAWNRDFSKQLATGFLLTLDNEIDQTTGTVKLRAQFANTDYALFPNEFVNARLLVRTIHQSVLVPTAAVQRTRQSDYVYVVEPDKTVTRRAVKVAASQGELTAISSGLQSGAVVVTDGLDKLQPGSKVTVRMEAQPASAAPSAVNPGQSFAGQ
ncbi:MAG TPA: efflux RND transporter periplasmic adaptor subunit [Candidatus Binataceae bacterium]|nr:efflux RND transporter periplasmic adaptor subunit [Candidatus Binataceae bacterium]